MSYASDHCHAGLTFISSEPEEKDINENIVM